MKNKLKHPTILLMVSLIALTADARDTYQEFSIESAMNHPEKQSVLTGRIQFQFGEKEQSVEKSYGVFTTTKKTNAFGKSDQEACDWAFLSAMKQFEDRALSSGGNAVINIRSVIGDLKSGDVYGCTAGNVIAGVELSGEVVKLNK